MLERLDFQLLADQLGRNRGRFLLSLSDLPEVRLVFATFHQAGVRTIHPISGNRKLQARARPELLISEWPIEECQNPA